jgi:very-short-patch-repair endonuclease
MELPRDIAALASSQYGVVSVDQLDGLGISRATRRRLVADGFLVPERVPRVLATAGAPTSWERTLQGGLLTLGPTAAISHRASAALHDFDRARVGAVEFCMPRAGRGRDVGLVVHTTSRLDPIDVVLIGGMRVTSASRTVIDLARLRVPTTELEAAIDSAVRLGLSSPVVLAERLAALRGRGRWGCRRLDELLVDSGGHSVLERAFLRLVREGGLPRPRCQAVHEVRGHTFARVDFLFEPFDLVVEVNGRRGHASDADRAKDAQRRNELQALGRTVFEFTYLQVTRRGWHVLDQLRRHLVTRGWRPDHPSWSESWRPVAPES